MVLFGWIHMNMHSVPTSSWEKLDGMGSSAIISSLHGSIYFGSDYAKTAITIESPALTTSFIAYRRPFHSDEKKYAEKINFYG